MAEAIPMVEARVCLADEGGELSPIRALLNEFGIGWADLGPHTPECVDLLISTPAHALSNTRSRGQLSARSHIVIARSLSRTLRKELERHPCDFVVETPVHPGALRALIEHSVYRGPERRSGLRAMLDGEVGVKAGFWTKKAKVLQLSERGLGLLLDQPLTPTEVTLRLPSSWTGGRKLELKAKLLDQQKRPGEGHVASFAFRSVDRATRKLLREIMKGQASHGGLLQPASALEADEAARAEKNSTSAAQLRAAATPKPAAADQGGAEKRRSKRKQFTKRVLATLRGQAQAVVSRDISAGGMRLDPDPDISEGDELKLALYGAKGSPPLVLRGVIVHADAQMGLGLEFVDVSPKMKQRLETLVNESPIFGPAPDDASEGGRQQVVVTEIVDRVKAEDD